MKKLAELLKSKGVGPQGSKSLSQDELLDLTETMLSNDEPMVTRATLLTAFLLLENTPAEEAWLLEFSQNENLPWELSQLLPSNFQSLTSSGKMHFGLSMHHKIIHQKELSSKETKKLTKFWLNPESDATLVASTLEGLRLKRETFDENLEIWKTLLNHSQHQVTEMSHVIDIADIYNGQNRFPLLSPALACLLAAADLNISLHGTFEAPPKFGVTVHKILLEAGIDPTISLKDSAKCLSQVGWSYTDQSVFAPELKALLPTRIEMVKRPCLATFEKLLMPLRGTQSQEIICGYTHKGYQELLPKLASELGQVKDLKLEAFVNIKGLEGGPMTPGNRPSTFSRYFNQELNNGSLETSDFELAAFSMELDKERSAQDHLAMNLRALREPESLEAQQLVYFASSIMHLLDPEVHPAAFARTLKSLLIQGEAYAKWQAAKAFHNSLNVAPSESETKNV